MDKYTPREADLKAANHSVKKAELIREILRNGPSLMTALEASREAERILRQQAR